MTNEFCRERTSLGKDVTRVVAFFDAAGDLVFPEPLYPEDWPAFLGWLEDRGWPASVLTTK